MKFVCSVCGYVYEGEKAPEECPICHAPASKFVAQSGEMNWAAEHVVGVAQGAPEDIIADLRANFEGEKAIPKSVCTGKRQLSKKLSTLQNLQSC